MAAPRFRNELLLLLLRLRNLVSQCRERREMSPVHLAVLLSDEFLEFRARVTNYNQNQNAYPAIGQASYFRLVGVNNVRTLVTGEPRISAMSFASSPMPSR